MLYHVYDIEENALFSLESDCLHVLGKILLTMFPRPNLIGFPVSPDQSFCRLESMISCTIDMIPPVKSNRICSILQPSVD